MSINEIKIAEYELEDEQVERMVNSHAEQMECERARKHKRGQKSALNTVALIFVCVIVCVALGCLWWFSRVAAMAQIIPFWVPRLALGITLVAVIVSGFMIAGEIIDRD
jgi:Flp pilus assembly protein TadB